MASVKICAMNCARIRDLIQPRCQRPRCFVEAGEARTAEFSSHGVRFLHRASWIVMPAYLDGFVQFHHVVENTPWTLPT